MNKLYISVDENKIYSNIKINYFKCFTEFDMEYKKISINELNDDIKDSKLIIDNLILIPFTYINNFGHLLNELFRFYITKEKQNLKCKNIYPIFFTNINKNSHNDLKNIIFFDLIFKGLNLNGDLFNEIYKIFSNKKYISIKDIYVVDEKTNYVPISVNNKYDIFNIVNIIDKPLFIKFKNEIIKNFDLQYSSNNSNITFILRKKLRVIENIEETKKMISQIIKKKINFIFLEDYTIKEQLKIILDSNTLIGVHGAGLIWGFFMKEKSKLIELTHKNSWNDNFIKWAGISEVYYFKQFIYFIPNSNKIEDFRSAKNVMLNINDIQDINKFIEY